MPHPAGLGRLPQRQRSQDERDGEESHDAQHQCRGGGRLSLGCLHAVHMIQRIGARCGRVGGGVPRVPVATGRIPRLWDAVPASLGGSGGAADRGSPAEGAARCAPGGRPRCTSRVCAAPGPPRSSLPSCSPFLRTAAAMSPRRVPGLSRGAGGSPRWPAEAPRGDPRPLRNRRSRRPGHLHPY